MENAFSLSEQSFVLQFSKKKKNIIFIVAFTCLISFTTIILVNYQMLQSVYACVYLPGKITTFLQCEASCTRTATPLSLDNYVTVFGILSYYSFCFQKYDIFLKIYIWHGGQSSVYFIKTIHATRNIASKQLNCQQLGNFREQKNKKKLFYL